MHKKEKDWLQGMASVEATYLRNEYLKARVVYLKAVKGIKGLISRANKGNWSNTCFPQRNFWRAE